MKRGLRLFLLRWHRRTGAAVCVFVVMLVITGIMLNHTGGLKLDKTPVRNSVLLALYGIEPPTITGWDTGDRWLGSSEEGVLLFERRELTQCRPPVQGAVIVPELLLVLCTNELLMLSPQGELIERVGSWLGLPEGLQRIGTDDAGRAWFGTAQQAFRLDPDLLKFEAAAPASVQWATAEVPPPEHLNQWQDVLTGGGIDWERLILDIHSGRILGPWGVWLVDLAALLFLMIALSGVWVWFTSNRR